MHILRILIGSMLFTVAGIVLMQDPIQTCTFKVITKYLQLSIYQMTRRKVKKEQNKLKLLLLDQIIINKIKFLRAIFCCEFHKSI